MENDKMIKWKIWKKIKNKKWKMVNLKIENGKNGK